MSGIDKSSRHTKIIGHFGEYLVCNWLSRSGFEVSVVDHTGIDLIAYNPRTRQRLGITVKSRTRSQGTETGSVYLLREAKSDRQKLSNACTSFCCDPWIAVYAECENHADLFLTSLANYDKRYKVDGKAVDGWAMTGKHSFKYASDPEVKHVRIEFKAEHWWSDRENGTAAN
jgi:Holliday junction resolvase-like predicted endonuclease